MNNVRHLPLTLVQLSDGYTGLFAIFYFCVIVIFGHYYLMQLLLAVINSNLMTILAEEARDDMACRMKIVA